MDVYFVRHGESRGNLTRVHQDSTYQLSKKGISQARKVAKKLKKINIDLIYASPFVRTRQTAEIISGEINLPIEYWNEIRERKRPSEIEHLRRNNPKAIKINKIVSNKQINADWKYSDDESFNELVERAKKVEHHLLKHHKDHTILCVSHGAIMKVIVLWMILQEKLTSEMFWEFYNHSLVQKTGITHVEYTNKNGWRLVSWNDTTHL